MRGRLVLLGVIVLALAGGPALAGEPQGPAWHGKMEKSEGLTIVSNPKAPLYRSDAVKLNEELSIGEAQGGKDYAFFRAWYIAVNDDGDIFVMDQGDACVKVYAKDGAYLRRIGRKGQGPGELQNPNTIHLTRDRRLVFDDYIRGLNIFTQDGAFVKFLPTTYFIDVLVTPEGRIVGRVNTIQSDRPGKEIRVYDGALNQQTAFLFLPEEPRNPQVVKPFAGGFHWALIQGHRVAVSYKEDYEIDVLSLLPGPNLRIRRDFSRVKITKEEIDDIQNRMRGRKMDIPLGHAAIQGISADDEGRVYAKTYEKTKDGKSFFYDIFDREGRYLARVPIPRTVSPKVWKGGKMYSLEEDGEGFQKVKRYNVIWQIPN